MEKTNSPSPAEIQNDTLRMNILEEVRGKLSTPTAERIFYIRYAFHLGMTVEEIHELTKIDPWFLSNIQEIVDLEKEIQSYGTKVRDLELWKRIQQPDTLKLQESLLRKAKEFGFSDFQLGYLLGLDETTIRNLRKEKGILPDLQRGRYLRSRIRGLYSLLLLDL